MEKQGWLALGVGRGEGGGIIYILRTLGEGGGGDPGRLTPFVVGALLSSTPHGNTIIATGYSSSTTRYRVLQYTLGLEENPNIRQSHFKIATVHVRSVAKCAKLCHSLNLISGSRWPKAVAKSCGGHIQSIQHVIQAVASCQIIYKYNQAVAKSCGGHIQSIPHVIQAVANLSSYSLGSQSGIILYCMGTLRHSPQLLLDFEIKMDTV